MTSRYLHFRASKDSSGMGPSDKKGSGRRILAIQVDTRLCNQKYCVFEGTLLVPSDK